MASIRATTRGWQIWSTHVWTSKYGATPSNNEYRVLPRSSPWRPARPAMLSKASLSSIQTLSPSLLRPAYETMTHDSTFRSIFDRFSIDYRIFQPVVYSKIDPNRCKSISIDRNVSYDTLLDAPSATILRASCENSENRSKSDETSAAMHFSSLAECNNWHTLDAY